MSRYSGALGIRTDNVETSPGIFEDSIEEIRITGDIYLKSARWRSGESAQDELSANQTVSFIAPESVKSRLDAVVYITWMGKKWSIQSLEYMLPRLQISLGGLYNG